MGRLQGRGSFWKPFGAAAHTLHANQMPRLPAVGGRWSTEKASVPERKDGGANDIAWGLRRGAHRVSTALLTSDRPEVPGTQC